MQYNLSEITELIRNRRSIAPENYTDRQVHQEQVELLLNNAIWAPNHGMTQPWRFVVFANESKNRLKDAMVEAMTQGVDPMDINPAVLDRMQLRVNKASVAIAICLHRDPAAKVPEWEEVAAMGAAIQNLHLTAEAYGLAGFWATPGVINKPSFQEFLGLDENTRCKGIFYLGYPVVQEYKSHRKPLEYVTKWHWGNED
jgi:nitroreductase